jgi:hypothetical protein
VTIKLNEFFSEVIVNFARAKARGKRELLKLFGISFTNHISLLEGEYVASVPFSKIATITPVDVLKIQNCRSAEIEVHGFSTRYLLSLEDANLVVDSHTGVVFIGNQIIAESSAWPKLWLALNCIPEPIIPKRLRDLENEICILLPSNGFYHSLIEDIPLFLYMIALFNKPTVLIPKNSNPWIREISGIYSNRVIEVPRYYKPQKHFFISRGGDSGWPHPADIKILREAFVPVRKAYPKNFVYVSRRNSTRSPVFETKLCYLLESLGWLVAYMENLSLIEQIEIFSSAKVVAGVHGAGLAGIVWMDSSGRVIELGPDRFVPCYARLAKIVGLKYLRVEFEDTMSDLESVLNSVISFSKLPD